LFYNVRYALFQTLSLYSDSHCLRDSCSRARLHGDAATHAHARVDRTPNCVAESHACSHCHEGNTDLHCCADVRGIPDSIRDINFIEQDFVHVETRWAITNLRDERRWIGADESVAQ
jgi:hypothetical protein